MKNLMDEVVKEAFRMFVEAMDENGRQKLLFPCRRDGISRHSEQEFRLMLIKALEEMKGVKYSIETPTMQRYSSQNGKLLVDPNGESGRIDLCIYQKIADKWKRLHMVELKAHNAAGNKVRNDLMKLFEDAKLNEFCKDDYFIQILYSADKGTLNSLQKKYKSYVEGEDKLIFPVGKEIIVYLLFVSGVGKEKEPRYYRFNLRDEFNISEFQKI